MPQQAAAEDTRDQCDPRVHSVHEVVACVPHSDDRTSWTDQEADRLTPIRNLRLNRRRRGTGAAVSGRPAITATFVAISAGDVQQRVTGLRL